MSISHVLDRLQRVKQSKPGAWMAACPCCESRKGRPLAVTETGDGRILLHAFCGCETASVLGRIGLELGDLFDQPLAPSVKPTQVRVPNGDVLAALSHEATTIALIAADFLENKGIDEASWTRLATAVQRVTHAADYCNACAK